MSLNFGELTSRLALGELKSTNFVSKDDPTAIKPELRSTIARYVNQGLGELHSKFILYERELLLRTIVGNAYYYLRPEFAWSNPAVVPRKYIDDLTLPKFTGDIIKILKVLGPCGGEVMRDNEDDPCCSIFTPQYDTLQVMRPRQGSVLHVIYQAEHPPLGSNDPSQQIRLPIYLEEALQLFVAAKALTHMNGQEQTAKGQEYMANYLNILAEVESKDLATTSYVRDGFKLLMRGFP